MLFGKEILFKNIALVIFLLGFSSCKIETVNDNFREKYSKEVEKISASRSQSFDKPIPVGMRPKQDFSAPIPQNKVLHSGQADAPGSEQYYANVDFEEYSGVRPKNHLPNASSYHQGRNAPHLPDDMFDLSYKTRLNPAFRKSGFEFDMIKVPRKDAYGVKTAMSEKDYLLVGNDSLLKNVDQINSQRSEEDIEMSETLIKEQKILKRRQKMIKIFGEKSLEADSVAKAKKLPNKKKMKK